ncbi:MAG: hypothetical protein JRN22_03630 [Nitrososphaerota archaeon]|jgi:energy-coupling factor transporter transmembrane protein EcfT|nr:hypothetical protein [Nitrososphaerota archaeon]
MKVFDYVASDDPMSRLDIRLKVFVIFSIGIVTLMKWNLIVLVLLLAITVLPYLIFARSSFHRLKWWGRFIALTTALLILSQGFFYWGYYQGLRVDVLFYLFRPNSNAFINLFTNGMGIALTSQGLYWGLLAGLKFGIMALAAALTIMSVSPREWSSLLSWIKMPKFLQRLFLATVRVTPMILEESLYLYSVARLRRPASIGDRIRLPYRLIKSMIFITIRKAMLLTIALEIKGEPKFRPERLKLKRKDLVITSIWIAAILLPGLL